MDWIIHLDTDKLLHPAGAKEYSLRQLLLDVPDDVDMVVFPNYESAIERDDIKEPFREAASRVQDHLRPNGAHRWHNYMKTSIEIKLEEAAVLHYTYTKFSDLTSRRDRCGCKPTKEDGWLPMASILVCILHFQLEISLKSGDLQDFQLFGDMSFFLENWEGKRLQNQLGILFQKLRASKVERDSKISDFKEPPPTEEEIKLELEEWDKEKEILEDQHPREENAFEERRNGSKRRKKLGSKDDYDMS